MDFLEDYVNFERFCFCKTRHSFRNSKKIPKNIVILFLFFFIMVLHAVPTPQKHQVSSPYRNATNVRRPGVEFLVKYGYLKPSKSSYSVHEVKQATKTFQKMFNLKPSRRFDMETLALMATPRCGLSDSQMRVDHAINQKNERNPSTQTKLCENNSTLQGKSSLNCEPQQNKINIRQKRFNFMSKWPNSKITYGFRSFADTMSHRDQEKAIANALKVWEDGTPLSFEQSRNTNADIMISFERGIHDDGYPFDGPGKTLAHAFYPGLHDRNGDVHFDKEEKWSSTPSEGTSLFHVAIHEFGHALGLGHSSSPNSIMLPYYQGRMKNEVLADKDRLAINYLYGENLRSDGILQKESPVFAPPTSPVENDVTFDDDCNLEFDAVANVREETFFFKGNKFWRFRLGNLVYRNTTMGRFWKNFPQVKVDAVYTKMRKIYIFSGINYWSYTDNTLDENNPNLISDYRLPMTPDDPSEIITGGIDAAFVWNALVDQKVFFVKGNNYWKYDNVRNQTDPGYPKKITDIGLPSNIDGAFTNPGDDELYFLKGKLCWRLNKDNLTVTAGPENIGEKWFGCNTKRNDAPLYEETTTASEKIDILRTSNRPRPTVIAVSSKREKGNGRASHLATEAYLLNLCLSILFLSVGVSSV